MQLSDMGRSLAPMVVGGGGHVNNGARYILFCRKVGTTEVNGDAGARTRTLPDRRESFAAFFFQVLPIGGPVVVNGRVEFETFPMLGENNNDPHLLDAIGPPDILYS